MVVRDLAANVPHAFLAVRADGDLFILDSRTSEVLRPEDLDAIQPVVTVTEQRNYVHGFAASAL
jgi:predicted transglutaminase-like cysteine proteinase